MADQPNRAPIKPNPLDVMSTWIFGEPVAGATKRPNFRLKVIGNVPRFTVKTNVPDDRDHGRIDFNCDLATFTVIMNFIEALGKGTEEGTYTLEYNDHVFVNGQRSDKPVTKASIKVGKDSSTGRIFIAVLGYNRPKIQFFFGPSNYHALKAGDGSVIDEGLVSRSYAVSFARSMMELVPQLLVSEFNADAKNVAKAPTGPGGQQGGGNNYNQRPQAPAPQANAASFESEFGGGDW